MASTRELAERQSVVDWETVDAEINSVPPEFREVLFHPLKHVVEVFSSADPQGLTQELRESSERLGYQLDNVVEGYHAGFARSIQNYSQILHLFLESKEQVESLKRSLADAARQLGAQSKYMNSQWRKTVSLEASLRLLADVGTVVEVPARVDAALAARDWPRAVSHLLEGATLLAHEELRRIGALRKLRSDMVSLAGWIQDQMMDELSARIYSGSRASTSAGSGAAAGGAGAGAGGGLAPGGAGGDPGDFGGSGAGGGAPGGGGLTAQLEGARVRGVGGGFGRGGERGGFGAGGRGRGVPGWRRKGPEPAYKLVTETLRSTRTASVELRNALSLSGSASLSGPGQPPGGPGGTSAGRADASRAGGGGGGGGLGALLGGAAAEGGGGLGGGGGDIAVDVEGAMRHVSTRDLVACLAQVDGVVEAKQHVAQRARLEMRALIRRSVETFIAQAAANAAAGDYGAAGLAGAGAVGTAGVGSGPLPSPARRLLSQRLVAHVATACLQVLARMQHVLVELANAPATTQSSALDVLVHLRSDAARAGLSRRQGQGQQGQMGHGQTGHGQQLVLPGGGRELQGMVRQHPQGARGGGGGLTARERTAYLREEYERMWDTLQEELQQLLSELLQSGAPRRPQAVGRGAGGGHADGAGGHEPGGGGGGVGGGVRALLSDLNPVHFLEQLAALAERTAELAETALGGEVRPTAHNPSGLQGSASAKTGAAAGGPAARGAPGGAAAGGAAGPPGGPGGATHAAAAGAVARRRPEGLGGSKLTFAFDVTIPGLSPDQLTGGGGAGPLSLRLPGGAATAGGGSKGSAGYGLLVQRALGSDGAAGSLHLLPDVYLPVLRLVGRVEDLLRLPADLQSGAGAAGAGAGGSGPGLGHTASFASMAPPSGGSFPGSGASFGGPGAEGPPVVASWLQHFLDEVALEQLLPQVWVELRGRCTAALEDAEAFRPQVGFSAAAAAAAASAPASAPTSTSAGAASANGGGRPGAAAAASGASFTNPSSAVASASAAWKPSAAPRAVVPLALFIEGVIRELMAAAAALPPFTSAFLAMAERILDRMLGAFVHMVRLLSADCPSVRLVGRSDVCLAMASERDALLLREPVAFAPQPQALPGLPGVGGQGQGGGAAGGGGATDLVAFLVALRTQERPLLVPPQLRPLAGPAGSATSGGSASSTGGRNPTPGFGADGDAAEAELQYFAMRERPTGQEQLVFGAGPSYDRAIRLAAMSESLDYVAEAVVRLTSAAGAAADGGGGGGAAPGRSAMRRGGSGRLPGPGGGAGGEGGGRLPDLLLPVVQSYKALSGHCSRLLRLESLLLVASHLAPVAATSHVCEEEDSMELHPSLGALTRTALRCSEELSPFLQPTKRAYVLGPIAAATARGVMWLLPAIHDINSLGVERMIRSLSLLQPPLTGLVNIADTAAPAAAPAAPAGAGGAGSGVDGAAALAAAAAAAAAAATAVPAVSGTGPTATLLAALLVHPETRGERGRLYDKARSYYGLLLVPPDEVVRAAGERPGRYLYAEWMALLQARVPHRTVTDVSLTALQRCLDRAYGLTPGAKVAEVVGAVVGAVQAPAERLGDVLLEGLTAGKDTLVDVVLAGKDTLVAGVRVPAQTLQRVFKRIGGSAAAGVRRRGGGGGGGGQDAEGRDLYRRST